jgi:hypothetical protein
MAVRFRPARNVGDSQEWLSYLQFSDALRGARIFGWAGV